MSSINQILTEMTYSAKKFGPAINRRVSITFRDTCLKSIFEASFMICKSSLGVLKAAPDVNQFM